MDRQEVIERCRRDHVAFVRLQFTEPYGPVKNVSIPVDELEDRISELSEDGVVVAYCRGPYCVYADEAVELLTARGRRAARLEGGYPEWAAAGLPTAAIDTVDTGGRS